jgi:hypothetical protein
MTSRECLAFLRDLGQLVASAEMRLAESHAMGCESCRLRLGTAMRLADALRLKPPVPARLRSPQFLESVHESVVRDFERVDGAEEAFARAVLQPLPAPEFSVADCLEQTGRGRADSGSDRNPIRDLVPGTSPAPSWLWFSVRDEIRRDLRARRRSASRARRAALALSVLTAASVLLIARITLSKGTPDVPEIVFLDGKDMPLIELSPVAVLRNGGVR